MSTIEGETVKAEDPPAAPAAVEDPTTAAAAATAAAATATTANTEALAAAAAAAVSATTAVEVPPSDTVAVGRTSLLSDVDGQGKRRFFPRVKHLIGNKEWEDFLTQVLQCIEEAGAPETSAASHKANNAWYRAFDLIYGGVAREYSIPTGKNRYHKFKDKILEVWVALESQAPGENHCRELAMEQYDRYKRACAEASKNGAAGHHGGTVPVKASKAAAGQTASAAYKLAGKRSYSTAMGGGASLPASSVPSSLWKNLDEKAVLDGMPEKLRSLIHLKQLSKEMAAGTANRAARKGIEEHSKKLDGAYMEALTEFLKDGEEEQPKEGGETETKPEDSADVEMAEAAAETEASTEDKPALDAAVAYDRSLAVAFLYRYASTLHEQKILAEAYSKYTAMCVTFVKEPEAAPAAETTEGAAAPEAAAPVTDEATAAAAAAAAMEENQAFAVQI